ncbi:MAG: serine hydrolase [Ferruginibacter sp.]
MIKSLLIFLLLNITTGVLYAQNPVSYPKDTVGLSAPELNFEIVWHTFEDNYANFRLREVDWHQVYKDYRPRISAQTSDDSLYSIFTEMLSLFQDNHINLIVPGVKQFKSAKPSQFVNEFPTDSLKTAFWNLAKITVPAAGLGQLQFIGPARDGKPLFTYAAAGKFGYLRFNRCFVDGSADNIPDAVVAGKYLDTIFKKFEKLEGLVIDTRDNIGGNDEFAYEVADRFVTTKQVGSYKKTRKTAGGYEEMVNPQTWYLEPKGTKPFTKPVFLLTNDKTVSAADVFALLMRQLPQVRIAGTNTRGIFSDMYGFTLPNKWLLSLSNERYFDADLVNYERVGVPVDIEIRNHQTDLLAKKDPVLTAAVNILKNKTRAGQIRMPSGKIIPKMYMDQMLQDAVDSFHIPGMSVAFINDGKIVYSKAFGYANLEKKIKADTNTLFEACSMSKPVFAYFVMKMVDKGIINLDTPLYKYAPYPEIAYDERYKLFTARMVLDHTTGLPNWHEYEPPDSSLHVPKGAQYIKFTPGTQFAYSGEGFQYLVNVMVVLLHTTTTDLTNIVHKEVCMPLAMRQAKFGWNNFIASHKAIGYRQQNDDGINKPGVLKKFEEFSAAGGLHTNANDYTRFIIGIMNGKGLSTASLNEMLKRQVYLTNQDWIDDSGEAWTLGFAVKKTKHGDLFSHSGNNGDFTCNMRFYKNLKCGFVILTNCNRSGDVNDKIAPIFR